MGNDKLTNNLASVSVSKNKESWFVAVRITCFVLATFFGLISGLLIISIVGIFTAIPFVLMSLGFLVIGLGVAKTKCPECSKEKHVFYHQEDFECPRCKSPVIIEWQ